MSLIPLILPPGFVKRGTAYSQQGRWRDGNLVRFEQSSVRPIGGWQQVTLTGGDGASVLLEGTVRSEFSWKDNFGRSWTAIGTTRKLYVLSGSRIYDATPVGLTVPGEGVGVQLGYGTGGYNTGNYNEPVGTAGAGNTSGAAIVYGYWHLDVWGENLVASVDSDGRVFEWNPNTPTVVAVVVANAPTFARGVAVTDERHMVVIGSMVVSGPSNIPKPRRVQWSHIEDNTDWTPSPTSAAGENDVQSQDGCMRVIKFKGEVLVFTGADLHRLVYVGYPYFYALRQVAGECGLANPGAVAMSSKLLFWVGQHGFFAYDGNQVSQVDSDLFDTPGDAAAAIAASGKTAVGHNKLHGEFFVFYASDPALNPDKYIIWSYKGGWWADGNMRRSCWYGSDVFPYPVAAQPYDDGGTPRSRLFFHEVGSQRPHYDGAGEFIESAPLEIKNGDGILAVDRVVQDADINEGARLRAGFSFFLAPNTPPIKVIAPVPLNLTRGYTDARGCGRMLSMRIEAETVTNGDWRIGNWRVDLSADGGR